ncbi:MAG TPA: site-specific integrase [Lachnospiraceae bacterium]|nr:site-specific integrase [Lachnospiraceae bacterium]
MKKEDYSDTEFPGIKKITKVGSKSYGKYLVIVDLGRQMKFDKKSGEMKLKQVKTQKVFNTLKECKSYQGQNNTIKNKQKVSGNTTKINIESVYEDYFNHNKNKWSESYKSQKNSEIKHIVSYFKNYDIKKITTLDIERFFKLYLSKECNLSSNSIIKTKSLLKDIWKFMKKDFNKYGIKENVIIDSDPGKYVKFEEVSLTEAEINKLLDQTLLEEDTSNLILVGMGLISLRRGEILGLKWGDIKEDFFNVHETRIQAGSVQLIKGTKNVKSTRIVCIPNYLKNILIIARKQQEELLGREINDEDRLYLTKINIVNNYTCHPGKSSRYYTLLLNRINKRLRKDGLEQIRKHTLKSLRTTFCSLNLNNNVSHIQVSNNCGHQIKGLDSNTTTLTYLKDDGKRDQIVNFMNSIIKTDFSKYL